MPTAFDELQAYPADTPVVSPQQYASNTRLPLSGRVITAVTSLPTQICKRADGTRTYWDVQPVRGQSAMYLSLFFLQQHTDWETHVVGWTGELVNTTPANDHPADITEDPLYLSDGAKSELERHMRRAMRSENVHPVWLLRRDQSRWRQYAEQVIWPLFHYIQGSPDEQASAQAWHDYVRFNEAYLQKIKAIYRPGDVVWIHDYYLLLLPQLVRMEFPDAYIGLYMHAPFPLSEYFRCLPQRTQVLDAMLGADRIAFQNELFQRHFISCCARVLGHEVSPTAVQAYGLLVLVATLPIGIDTAKTAHDAFSPDVDAKIKALRAIYPDKKIIVGRDRLDLVRGVVQKLEAVAMLLHMYPEWRGQVVLIQVLLPGFSHSARVEKRATELVLQINAQYGSLDYTPVVHYHMRIHKDEYLALLRVADLALITPVRDGMNTTSLEFVVCQRSKKLPLVLSEFTGTALVLPDAMLVNPWDLVGVARTIHECLQMPQRARAELQDSLYAHVCSNTVQLWTSNFLAGLVEQVVQTHQTHSTPTLNRPLLYRSYSQLHRRLFLFDYDGTLTPIVRDPAAAIPSSKLFTIIDKLAADPRNQIWIISGRDQAFLEKWWGDRHVGLLAEHGCFMKDVGSREWHNLAASFDMSWQLEVDKVFSKYTAQTLGLNIERKKVALTWHYRRADPDLGSFQAEKCMEELREGVAKAYDVEVMAGKANIEVRPRFVNKGEIVKRLVLTPHGSRQDPHLIKLDPDATPVDQLPDFMLCLGDDLTDEDMFRSLRDIEGQWHLKDMPRNCDDSYGVYPVLVGPAAKKTLATAHLNDPSQVIDTLGLLAGEVSLFESAGSVDLDDRGHVANSESSRQSQLRLAQQAEKERGEESEETGRNEED